MGMFGYIFFSEEITQLEAFKKTLKDPAEIADVEKTIELFKKKEAEKKGE
jgi:hypothetical protein